MKVISETRREH